MPIISKLNAALVQTLETEGVAERIRNAGNDVVGSSSEELYSLLSQQIRRLIALGKSAGTKAECD
jgi:tripartite-type tricarboxylate transporter receptor subunit TctC